jgi:hypothetical protein
MGGLALTGKGERGRPDVPCAPQLFRPLLSPALLVAQRKRAQR